MNENKLHYTHENTKHLENDDNILKSYQVFEPVKLTPHVNSVCKHEGAFKTGE